MASNIRDQIRSDLNELRLNSRDKIFTRKRKALNDYTNCSRQVSEKEVVLISNKIKCKSTFLVDDLNILKIAFIQNDRHIVSFLKVKGALHSLIRELSSLRSNHQLAAAECICNLSLGDATSCLMVAKAASPYLITHMSGSNTNLINASVWALGNIVGSDEKAWQVIYSQGFLGKLLKLIKEYDVSENEQINLEIQQNSLVALVQFLKIGLQYLSENEILSISKTICKLSNTSGKSLRVSEYLLACTKIADSELIYHKIHVKCLMFLKETDLSDETIASFTASLRTLANMIAEPLGRCCLDIYASFNELTNIAQKIITSPYRYLIQEFCWLIGNIMNHPSPEVQATFERLAPQFQMLETQLIPMIC